METKHLFVKLYLFADSLWRRGYCSYIAEQPVMLTRVQR